MQASISHCGRLTIVFVAILAHEVHAQDSDELLREFSTTERASIRSACYGAGLFGPARFYECLVDKANELRQSPGEPTLAEFSRPEQTSMRSACYGAGLFGPARFYACLRDKADELRTVRRQLGLSSLANSADTAAPSPTPAQPPQAPAPSTFEQATEPSAPVVSMPAEPRAPATPSTPFSSLEDQQVSEGVALAPPPKPVTPAPAATSRTATANPITSVVPVSPDPLALFAPVPSPAPSSSPSAEKRSDFDTVLSVAFWLIVGLTWFVRYRRSRAPQPHVGTAPAAEAPPPSETYRPRSGYRGGTGITFTEPRIDTLWSPHEADLTDVRDAVTGQTLSPALGLHRCMYCQVFYQTSSVEWLRRANGGCCISCGTASVRPIGDAPTGAHDEANETQDITTLENYRWRVGQVVVFEGRCVRVLRSRSGTAYAVMFEDRPWTEGFKLVVRTGFVAHVGGDEFIRSLAGRTIRAQGLITHSPVFGFEITVTTRSMILGVW